MFTEADVDAARAAGLLLSLDAKTRWGTVLRVALIGDREWLADRVSILIDRAETEATKEAKEAGAAADTTTDQAEGDPDAAKRAAAEKKAANQREQINRREAKAANEAFGKLLDRRIARPRFTLDAARAVALTLLTGHSANTRVQDGLAETNTFLTDGNEALPVVDILDRLRRRVLAAASPEEALAPALQMLIASVAVDRNPGFYGVRQYNDGEVAVIALARGLDVLPDRASRLLESGQAHQAAVTNYHREYGTWKGIADRRRVLRELSNAGEPLTTGDLDGRCEEPPFAAEADQLAARGMSPWIDDLDDVLARLVADGHVTRTADEGADDATYALTDAGRAALTEDHPPEPSEPTSQGTMIDRAAYEAADVLPAN